MVADCIAEGMAGWHRRHDWDRMGQGVGRRGHKYLSKFCVEGSQLLGRAGGEGGERYSSLVRVFLACMVTAAAHEELDPMQLSHPCSSRAKPYSYSLARGAIYGHVQGLGVRAQQTIKEGFKVRGK
jgi:hypothetical protein